MEKFDVLRRIDYSNVNVSFIRYYYYYLFSHLVALFWVQSFSIRSPSNSPNLEDPDRI